MLQALTQLRNLNKKKKKKKDTHVHNATILERKHDLILNPLFLLSFLESLTKGSQENVTLLSEQTTRAAWESLLTNYCSTAFP